MGKKKYVIILKRIFIMKYYVQLKTNNNLQVSYKQFKLKIV